MTPSLAYAVAVPYVLLALLAAERWRTRAALRRRSQEEHKLFFETNPVPMWVYDEGSRVLLDANDAFVELFGYRRAELLRMTVDELAVAPHGEFLHVLHPDPKADSMRLYRRKDGGVRELWIDEHAVPYEGRPSARLVLARDVTEYRRSRRQLASMARELERSNKDLEEFAYAASHDLQEPLRKISNFTDLLDERCGRTLDADSRLYLNRIKSGAERLHGMIDDLLRYARLSRQAPSSTNHRLSPMGEIFDEVIDDFRPILADTSGKVTRDELPAVAADPVLMRQLLRNLLSNAIKFRSESPPRVHLACKADGAGATFCLQDNGIGIDPDQKDGLFRIFKRLHPRDKYPGAGLGLALCKKIVERHGGAIWIESKPASGTTFYFTLALPS